MTYHSSHSLCSPSSGCPCLQRQPIGHSNLSRTHPSSYNNALSAPGPLLDVPNIDIPQNNRSPLSPSTTSSVTPSSPTRNDGRTGTLSDSLQLAQEYARWHGMQPSHIGPSSFLGFLEYPPDGHPGNVGLGGMHPTSSLASENPTPWQAGGTDHYLSLHRNASVDTVNQRSTSGSSSLTTVSSRARTFVSSIPPQPPGVPPFTQGARRTPGSASIRGGPQRNTAGESRDRVLRDLGRWLSTHEYFNTGQEPIVGDDCPPEADLLGIRGMPIFTAFFDHTNQETFSCHVCPDISNDLNGAIIHQRRARHHQD